MTTPSDITFFAQTKFRNRQHVFGIKTDDRRRHVYIIGKTGMGKTTLLEQFVTQDIQNGHGIAYIDPHGDTAEKILSMIPPERVGDVIYFNPADQDYPIAFNVMEHVEPQYRHLVASGLVGVFKKLWADSWGPRLEYILRNALLALLETPDSTLLGVMRILVDKNYRKRIVANITDPVVKSFWVDEFPKWNDRVLQEVIAPIQNKVGQFLTSSLIRNIVGQTRSAFSIREAMDQKKILIMNLSKGRIGEDNSALLGAMMITKIQMAAMSRVDTSESQRPDFYLYVDEFQNFATESFANILSEARKYRLNLTLANQYITQIDEVVRDAIFGNVGTMITFRVGAADAEFLEKEFDPIFLMNDIVNLPKYHIYLKLMIDGVAGDAFSAMTLPPVETVSQQGQEEAVIAATRKHFASSRAEVERKIALWSGNLSEDILEGRYGMSGQQDAAPVVDTAASDDVAPAVVPAPTPAASRPMTAGTPRPVSAPAPDDAPRVTAALASMAAPRTATPRTAAPADGRVVHETTCSNCGVAITLPFVPDGKRPTFCKNCLADYRRAVAKNSPGNDAVSRPQREHRDRRDTERQGADRHKPTARTERPERSARPAPSARPDAEHKVFVPQERPLSLSQMTHIAPKDFKRSFRKPDTSAVRSLLASAAPNRIPSSDTGDDTGDDAGGPTA